MVLRRLLVRGPFRGPTGYDHHVREFVREFDRQGVAVQLVDVPEWGPARLAPEQQDPWFDSLQRDVGATVALHFTMPHQVAPYDGMVNVNYTMFEATRVHPGWIGHSSRHALVIVPTESSRQAWLASGLNPGKIRVSPLGVDAARFGDAITPRPIFTGAGDAVARFRVRFLNVSDMGPRKNLAGLLRVWLRATTPQDDAILALKLGLYSPGWAEAWQQTLSSVQAEVGKRLDEAAPLHVEHATLADAEMPGLYAAATHYVSLSFGEGWDQPMMEAAASGLRLIAPDHSAYRAYLDHETATLIPTQEAPSAFIDGGTTSLLFRHANWWAPDEDAAIAAIQGAIEGRDTPTRSARERIFRDFTWERATERLIALLDEAQSGDNQRRGWLSLPWARR